MKSCENFEPTLSALVDGETETSELLPTLDHLVACEECRRFYRQARGLEGVLAALRDPRTAPSLPSGGWPRIAHEAELQPRWRQLRTKVWAAAAAMVFAVGLWTARSALRPDTTIAPPRAELAEIRIPAEGTRDIMTERRFVELTAELLQSDRRYRQKMQEVLEEVSSQSFIPEGSNDLSSGWSEGEPEGTELETEDPFQSIGSLWW